MQKNVLREDLTVRQQGLKWPLFLLDSDASSVCGLLDFPNTNIQITSTHRPMKVR